MKIIVIGDIHGDSIWKEIIKQEKTFDKVVFLGDYWDSFSINSENQKKNYIAIQEFREENSGKVITLLGNHDFHYLYPTHYSGWKNSTKFLATPLLEVDIRAGKLPYAYRYEDIIFSHAGVTQYWLDNVAQATLEELLAGEIQLRHFDWNSKLGSDPYGDTISNSPMWVRPYSLKRGAIDGYKQVVGHTQRSNIEYNTEKTIYFCDTLPNEYLIIEDGEFIKNTIDKK